MWGYISYRGMYPFVIISIYKISYIILYMF